MLKTLFERLMSRQARRREHLRLAGKTNFRRALISESLEERRLLTSFTTTSPIDGGQPVPAGVTQVGGVVIDMVGANGARITSQLAASSLFTGFFDDGSPVAFRGNPGTIGVQSGFSPAVVSALGGGIDEIAIRLTIDDGDTQSGNFDFNDNEFRLNGFTFGNSVSAANFSNIATQRTSSNGLTLISSGTGFGDNTLDTGWFYTTNATFLANLYTNIQSTNKIVVQLYDTDPYDNFFDFSAGVDGGLINVGQPPNVAPLITSVTNSGPIYEGSLVTVTINANDPDNTAGGLSYQFDFNNDGIYEVGPQASNSSSRTFVDDNPSNTPFDLYTVRVRVSDSRGGIGNSSTVVRVNNKAPIANAGPNQTASEGDTVTLTGSFTDNGVDDGHKQEWSVVASNGQTVPGQTINNLAGDSNGSGGSSFNFTPDNDGTYTVTYRVTDDDGGVHADTSVITVNNALPSFAFPPADQSSDEGETKAFNLGSFTDPGDDAPWNVTVAWGDGTVDTFTTNSDGPLGSRLHTYGDDGTYTVTVTVEDDDDSGSTSFDVEVANLDPTIDPISDGSSLEGLAFSFTAAFSDPEFDISGGISSFIRMAGIGGNFGNREFDEVFSSGDRPGSIDRVSETVFNALTPAQLRASYDVLLFTWASSTSLNGDWDTRIKPFLDLGGSVFWEDDRNIGDLAPGVNGFQFDGSYGSSYELAAIPGLTDSITGNFINHHLQVSSWLPEFAPFIFGPGGTPTLGLAGIFPSGGRMIVTGPDMDFHASRGSGGAPGNQYQFILNQVDWLVTRSEFQATIDWGDGHVESGTVSSTNGQVGVPTTGTISGDHVYADNGIYTVTVTVDDEEFGTDVATFEVTVGNQDPALTATADLTEIDEGGAINITALFSDPGFDNPLNTVDPLNGGEVSEFFDYVIDWGDGTIDTVGSLPGIDGQPTSGAFGDGHIYADNGNYTITVTVNDDDGGSDFVEIPVTVNNVAPTLSGLSATSILENGTTTLSGAVADVGLLDTFTVDIDWDNDGTYDESHTGLSAGTFSYTHKYLDDAPSGTPVDDMPIKVRVTDDDSGSVTDSTTVEVTNDVPQITSIKSGAEECGTAHEDDPITLVLNFDDDGSLDVHTVFVDWGDSIVETIVLPVGNRSLSVDHDYAAGGIYTIAVSLTDDDTGQDSASRLAVVSGVGVHDGVLQIIGTSLDDHVTLNQTGDGILKVHADFIEENVVGGTRDFPLSDITSILAILCEGDDHLTISSKITLNAIIDGGAGSDHLNGGGGSNLILGQAGDDHINGGSARDILIGGFGADRIVGNPGRDLLSGGRLSNKLTGVDDTIANLADLQAMQAKYKAATDAEIDGWLAGVDDFFDNLSVVDDDGEEDKLTDSSGEDWLLLFANDVWTDASSKGKGNK